MLETALRVNFSKFYSDLSHRLSAADYEPRVCAIDVELEAFKSSKLANGYRASIMKSVNEIKQTTLKSDLHASMVPKSDVHCADELSNDDDVDEESENANENTSDSEMVNGEVTPNSPTLSDPSSDLKDPSELVEPISDFSTHNGELDDIGDPSDNVEPLSDFYHGASGSREPSDSRSPSEPGLTIDYVPGSSFADSSKTESLPSTSTSSSQVPVRPKMTYFFEKSSDTASDTAKGSDSTVASHPKKKTELTKKSSSKTDLKKTSSCQR